MDYLIIHKLYDPIADQHYNTIYSTIQKHANKQKQQQ